MRLDLILSCTLTADGSYRAQSAAMGRSAIPIQSFKNVLDLFERFPPTSAFFFFHTLKVIQLFRPQQENTTFHISLLSQEILPPEYTVNGILFYHGILTVPRLSTKNRDWEVRSRGRQAKRITTINQKS